MENTFTIEIPFLLDGERKIRLLTPAERSTLARRAEESEAEGRADRAEAMRRLIASNDEAAENGAVCRWTATFRLPTYRDGIGIKAIAMSEMAAWAAEVGEEPTNATLRAFTAEVRARVLCRGVIDEGGARLGGFEAIPEEWRADVADLVELATGLTEEDRRPLFGGPEAAPTT